MRRWWVIRGMSQMLVAKWLSAHESLPEWNSLRSAGLTPGFVQLRLPIEAEWVVASGGSENDRFAWGALENLRTEISRYANTDESGIGHTTPVWMYPQGESQPHGVMDMSGNVFEWQANHYSESRKSLGWRGGSWNFDCVDARVALRGNYIYPLDKDYDIGFRVVAVSPPH